MWSFLSRYNYKDFFREKRQYFFIFLDNGKLSLIIRKGEGGL